MKLADYVVTEAGFGADLGAEKFVDIKCRKAGLKPAAAVVVATVRALKYHGGGNLKTITRENLPALEKGLANLERHVENVQQHYGIPCVVAVNRFVSDTEAELKLVEARMAELGVSAVLANHWAEGGKGAADLARVVVDLCERKSSFHFVYEDADTLWEKIEDDRAEDLWRLGGHRERQGAGADRAAAGGRLRALPGLRGEDPVLLLDRRPAPGRLHGPPRSTSAKSAWRRAPSSW